jgi:predicted permease
MIGTLALGVGLVAGILSFADGYLFRPLPFPGADRVYEVRDPDATIARALKATEARALAEGPASRYGFVEWSVARSVSPELQVGERRIALQAYEVSQGFRDVVKLPLALGRDFTAADHVPGAPGVAWLTWRFWQRELGGDPNVIGTQLRGTTATGEQVIEVVGVLSRHVSSFDLNNRPPDLVVPAPPSTRVGPNMLASPLIALPEGVSVEQATAEISAALQSVAPAPPDRVRRVTLSALVDLQIRGGAPTARVLLTGALLVFVLAAMNLVHLTLGRAVARSHEFTIRASLGASRWRLLRLGVVESLLLAATGISAGLALGFTLFQIIATVVPDFPTAGRNLALVPMAFDGRVVIAASLLGLIVALLGGVLPMWWARRQAAVSPGRSTTDRRTSRAARLILTSELTIATVVLVGTTFIGVGIYRYLNQPLGFQFDDTYRVTVSRNGRLPGPESASVMHALAQMPGVRGVGPYQATPTGTPVGSGGRTYTLNEMRVWTLAPGFLDTWRPTLRSGRWFAPGEYVAAPEVVIVDRNAARLVFGDRSPLGETIRVGDSERTVIGVTDVRRDQLEREPVPVVYLPAPATITSGTFALWHPSAEIDDVTQRVQSVVSSVSPGSEVIVRPVTFDTLFLRGVGEPRFQAPIVLAFGILAVLLASVGVFGVVSYQVEGRTREFAIRIALGATRLEIWRRVVREAVVPATLGLVIGSTLAWWLERTVESAAFGWSSSGPLAIGVVAVSLLIVAVLATLRPARRAATVDPATTLRA